jgi:hypothetical protein
MMTNSNDVEESREGRTSLGDDRHYDNDGDNDHLVAGDDDCDGDSSDYSCLLQIWWMKSFHLHRNQFSSRETRR